MTAPRRRPLLPVLALAAALAAGAATAQTPLPAPDAPAATDAASDAGGAPDDPGPLVIEITRGVIQPAEIALAAFHDEGGAGGLAPLVRQLVADDLEATGLFHIIPTDAHLEDRASFDDPVHWPSWRAIHAEALVTGAVAEAAGRVTLSFRLHDVVMGRPLGQGMRFDADSDDWRRLAHKTADQIYSRMTGEGAYLDSRIVFVAEDGPPEARVKRLAIMDADGARLRMLTDGRDLVLAPHLSRDGRRVVYTSFSGGMPRIALMDLATARSQILQTTPGTMSFAPRWSPDGRWIVYSQEQAGDTDIWLMDAATGAARPLTRGPSIDTAPGFAPDGRRIVFESDRSGTPQLYVLSLDDAASAPEGLPPAQRISFGAGRYGTPAWSPRGDLIAFTRQITPSPAPDEPAGVPELQIGVMRPDGNDERILTRGYLDEGPSWSPNGRVLIFTRQEAGGTGKVWLHSVDVTGRNLRAVRLDAAASDPDWGPLLP